MNAQVSAGASVQAGDLSHHLYTRLQRPSFKSLRTSKRSIISTGGRYRVTCRAMVRDPSARAAVTETAVEEGVELLTEEVPDSTGSKKIDVSETVMLQGFGWNSCRVGGWYNIVKGKIPEFKDGGFTHIWLPPPSQSVSAEGYLPCELYNLNTHYGSRDELGALNKALMDANVLPVCDIVINHRSAAKQGPDGKWNQFTDVIDHPGERLDWGPWAITGNDPEFGGTGGHDTGDDFNPAPDVDHRNEKVRRGLTDWLKWLHSEIGFQGWRFDYVKGFGASYVKEYIEGSMGSDVFHVGEYWTDLNWEGGSLGYQQDGARQCLCNWLDEAGASSLLFDFPLKGILNAAAGECSYNRLNDGTGKAPGLIGWWPSRAVTFVDNHDTGSTQQHWPFPSGLMDQGYAYILTHPGCPSVLWEHYFDWGLKPKIDQLLAVRKRNGVKSDSKLEIKAAYPDMYVAVINGSVMLKMGPRYDMGDLVPKEGEGWKFAVSGTDWAVWEKAAA